MYNINDKASKIIEIGVEDTNRARKIPFNIAAWVNAYPTATRYEILLLRNGDDAAYPVVTEREGNTLLWVVKYADTEKPGMGTISVHCYEPDTEDGIYVKSQDIPVRVIGSKIETRTEPPEEEIPWVLEALEAKQSAIAAAAQAAESVEHYPRIGENGNWYVWDAATEEFVDTGDPARGEQGEQGATGPQGPAGPQGPQGIQGNPGSDGQDGQDGQDGVSPAVTVTEITGGHTVKITDAAHPDGQTFQVMDGEQGIQGNPGSDGQDGQDGVSPAVTVTEITGGYQVKITDAAHPDGQTFQVMNGADGAKGDPGEDGDDAPQIDDTQASADHPWSGSKINTLLSGKVNQMQAVADAGKVLLIAADGEVAPNDIPKATTTTFGGIKVNGGQAGTYMTSSGLLAAQSITYAVYSNSNAYVFVGKQTLENLINAGHIQRGYIVQTVTIAAASWSGGSVTVNVTGVTANSLVIIQRANAASEKAWNDNGIFDSAHGNGTITFTSETAPSIAIDLRIYIF